MIDLDIRINLIGQNENNLIIEFSVSNEWTNIQEISKTATIQKFIELYETITPDTVEMLISETERKNLN